MSSDLPNYRVPVGPEHKPRLLNKDVLAGGTAGFLIGLPFAAPIGGVIGAVLGKKHLENEQEFGKVVKPPTPYNKESFIGVGFGSLAGAVASVATVAVVGVFAAPAVATLAGLATIGALAFAGFKKGSDIGKERMQKEYSAAASYVAKNGNYDPKGVDAPKTAASAEMPQQASPLSTSPQVNLSQIDQAQLAQLKGVIAKNQSASVPQQESMVDKLENSRPTGPQLR